MKKIVAFLLAMQLCVSVCLADELVLGSHGEDVLRVQQRLIELGYMTGTADGAYGNQTMLAVQQFQRANGLKVTGTATDALQKKLFEGEVLTDEVVLAQNRLIELGYLDGAADGIWGAKSAEAMKHFQRVNGLEETGTADEASLAALFAETAKRDEMRHAQKRLAELGYYNGAADGEVSEAFLTAVQRFQRVNGLEVTGEADTATLQAIAEYEAEFAALKKGSDGDAVRALQMQLIRLGFMDGSADGDYGKKTEAGVKAFQAHLKAQGEEMAEDGVASPLMQAYLFSDGYSTFLKELRAGDEDGEVLRVERRLAQLGYMDAAADEVFDDYAVQALRMFQQAESLAESGVADEASVTKLFAADTAQAAAFVPHAVALGDSGLAVQQLQKNLQRWGMLAYYADGEYSANVESALQRLYEELKGAQHPKAELFADAQNVSIEAQQVLQEIQLERTAFDAANPDSVKQLQRRLASLLYMAPKHVDGMFGKSSQKALTNFQVAHGLEATGAADEATLQMLYSEEVKQHRTPYKLEISIDAQRVYVFELNENGEYEQINTFICSTGLGNTTPKGVFVGTQPGNRWHYFKKFDCWAQYTYQIDGDILFHSVLYDKDDVDTLRMGSVYALGSKASHGCVRLKPEDAKWIFVNCERGTIVEVY